ncbi:hypothetical protein HMPREF1057_01091 [Bacteroides finegoldii CL09T03C10]|uniref:Uncharacterized protein n=1 Tax=Bacteroides finegoldii CL09T03C10 TaxID=997888 RepID=K5CR05_9BACE|nr:hypothetical protein HMPREF1057_01091 [Bacteroides finegoldii CL09T03C10]
MRLVKKVASLVAFFFLCLNGDTELFVDEVGLIKQKRSKVLLFTPFIY